MQAMNIHQFGGGQKYLCTGHCLYTMIKQTVQHGVVGRLLNTLVLVGFKIYVI